MARILVVDDDPGLQDTLRFVLRHAGHDVLPAGCGQEALAALQASACDLALVDVRLPDISGLDLLPVIRERALVARVLVMTAFPQVADAVKAIKLGAVDYVQKWFEPEDCVRSVERALAAIPSGSASFGQASGLARWASAVSAIVEALADPTTEAEWAALLPVHVAPETLRGWIRTTSLSAKDSLDLGRILRALHLARERRSTAARFLNVADGRTLRRLLQAAGLTNSQRLPTLNDVLARQILITDPLALDELRNALRGRGIVLDA